jgi:hypothetical protein
MDDNNHVYMVLGMVICFGLMAVFFTKLIPGFRSDAFRALPAADQRVRLRRTRRAGAALVIIASLATVGFGVVNQQIAAHEHRRAERAPAVRHP